MATLLDFLKGLNPAYAGMLPGEYLSQQNTIQQALANRLFGLDLQEQDVRQGYERNLGNLNFERGRGQQDLRNAMANRGTLRSGMTVRGAADINRISDDLLAQLSQSRQSALNELLGSRLTAQSDASGAIADLQTKMANQGMQAAVADATAQAQMRAQQQQAGYQQQQYDLNKAIAEAQIRAYQGSQTTQMPPGMNVQAPSWWGGTSGPTVASAPAPAPTGLAPLAPSQPNVKPRVPTSPTISTTPKPYTSPSRYLRPV